MFSTFTLTFAIVVLFASPIVARIAGRYFSKSLEASFGHARDWMPTLPNHAIVKGEPGQRWQKRVRRLEMRALPFIEASPTGVTADLLAGELSEDVSVADAVLERLRDEIPSRLKVTRSGRLIHDFDAADIRALKRRNGVRAPARVLLFTLALLANAGAAWPILMAIFVGMIAFVGMAGTNPIATGIGGIVAILAMLGGNVLSGVLVKLVLTPPGGPSLGSTTEAENQQMLFEAHDSREAMTEGSFSGVDVGFLDVAAGSGCEGIPADVDLDIDFRAILIGLIALILLSMILACIAALFVWIRGVWRAVARIGMPEPILSPTAWIRGATPVDTVEKLIPTNDLVVRIGRTVGRVMSRTHVEDGGMAKRVLARAAANSGRIGALELMLAEGLDQNEAMSVGARLTGYFSGKIHVAESGEIEFVFPESVLPAESGVSLWDLNAEYVMLQATDRHEVEVLRRVPQPDNVLPLNLPGLSHGHLTSTYRLVAGTVFMQLCAMLAVHMWPGAPSLLIVAVDFVFPLFTLGAFTLAGAARYTASRSAQHGIMRDIRRAGFFEVNLALESSRDTVDFKAVEDQLFNTLINAWSKLKMRDIAAELRSVAVDLDLEPTAEDGVYSIAPLRDRLGEVHESRVGEVVFNISGEDDDIVFDSQISHERIYAL